MQLFVRQTLDDYQAFKMGSAIVAEGWRLITVTLGPVGHLQRVGPNPQLWWILWFEVPANLTGKQIDSVLDTYTPKMEPL